MYVYTWLSGDIGGVGTIRSENVGLVALIHQMEDEENKQMKGLIYLSIKATGGFRRLLGGLFELL